MSPAPIAATEDASAERWRQWQLRSAAASRKDAARARIVFTLIFVAVGAWLGWQLLSSPIWA